MWKCCAVLIPINLIVASLPGIPWWEVWVNLFFVVTNTIYIVAHFIEIRPPGKAG